MELNQNQKKAIEATENKVLVVSSAGSGKTTTLTERIKFLLNQGVNPNQIVAISFTNMSAEEMRRRIPNAPKELFIGTLHSYANKILQLNGVDTTDAIANQKFDWLINEGIKAKKIPTIRHLLIDEFQDLCDNEYSFAFHLNADNFYAVGDPKQYIYGFKGANDDFIFNLYYDKACTKYYLRENYRSYGNILSFAEEKIQYLKRKIPCKIIPKLQGTGYIEKCSFSDALQDLYYSGDWNNWFILARTNAEIEYVMGELRKKSIPCTTFKQADMNSFELDDLMQEDTVKVLTVHAAKGLEREKVIVVGAKMYNEDEERISYVAATRAKKVLYWCPSPKIAKNKYNKHVDNRKSTKLSNVKMMEW
jgi:DNA helicase-2/ATP-dependent DNA helicase PcrA